MKALVWKSENLGAEWDVLDIPADLQEKAAQYREELIREGGKRTVPCLKITNEDQSVTWMYESGDIINYLEKFAG